MTIQAQKSSMNIVIVGHVDHGKSTLVGRLFYDTNSLPEGRYDAVARVCEDTGKPFELAFLLDALEEERDQGITIDTAQAQFHTALRDYVLIDAPGHKEFLKNMVTGASSAEAAILLIDAAEGVQEQSRRHGYILHLLGIKQVTVAINKMDLVGYSQEVFEKVRDEYIEFLKQLGVHPASVIPVSAREGDNIASKSDKMSWYTGPSIIEALDNFTTRPSREFQPLRFPVQDVYKFDHRRIVAGRIESGTIGVGDKIVFSPSGHHAVVKTIERWNSPNTGPAFAGESIGITLTEPIFVERGEIISHVSNKPTETTELLTNIFWLGNRHLVAGKQYVLKLATQEIPCQISSIITVMDTSSLDTGNNQYEVAKNEVANVLFSLKKPVAFDEFTNIVETGRFVLVDGYDVAGGGIALAPIIDNYTI